MHDAETTERTPSAGLQALIADGLRLESDGLNTSPLIVAGVRVSAKPTGETDAERIALLEQQVVRLETELRQSRNALVTATNGCAVKGRAAGGTPMTIVVRGTEVPVLIVDDGVGRDDWYIGSVWTGVDWLDADYLEIRWMDDAIDAVRAVWADK
jgi:hypothetical protein